MSPVAIVTDSGTVGLDTIVVGQEEVQRLAQQAGRDTLVA